MIVVIQACARGAAGRRESTHCRREHAARELQLVLRSLLVRKAFTRTRCAAVVAQAWMRQYPTRAHFL